MNLRNIRIPQIKINELSINKNENKIIDIFIGTNEVDKKEWIKEILVFELLKYKIKKVINLFDFEVQTEINLQKWYIEQLTVNDIYFGVNVYQNFATNKTNSLLSNEDNGIIKDFEIVYWARFEIE